MKKYIFCLIFIMSSIIIHAEKRIVIYNELQKIIYDVYYKFHETNNRIPISFNDFLENLPERQELIERDTSGLIEILMNNMAWLFTYSKIDENNFELSIQDNDIIVMYQSETDRIITYANGMIIRNNYSGIREKYIKNNQ